VGFKKGRKHVKNVEHTPKPMLIPHYTNWVEELKLREDRQRLLSLRKSFGKDTSA
jgi:hypothetical protein